MGVSNAVAVMTQSVLGTCHRGWQVVADATRPISERNPWARVMGQPCNGTLTPNRSMPFILYLPHQQRHLHAIRHRDSGSSSLQLPQRLIEPPSPYLYDPIPLGV